MGIKLLCVGLVVAVISVAAVDAVTGELKRDGSHHVTRRATVSQEDKKWENATIKYHINESEFTENEMKNIMAAMVGWTNETCLEFTSVPENSSDDHVVFKPAAENGPCDSHVGRQGGQQFINLTKDCLEELGPMLHVVGKAIGFYPETKRPDRDRYIEVLHENIDNTKKDDFLKINESEVDYQGTEYDLYSVMHHSPSQFCVNGDECMTFVVNETAYNNSGRLMIGHENATELSPSDKLRANRMHNCPAPGQKGTLQVRIDQVFNETRIKPGTYVQIRAVDESGREYRQNMSIECGEISMFDYREWQYFKITAWNDDTSIAMSKLVNFTKHSSITKGERKYCLDFQNECNNFLRVSYKLRCVCHNPSTRMLKVISTYTESPDFCPSAKTEPFLKMITDFQGRECEFTTNLGANQAYGEAEYAEVIEFCSARREFTVSVWDDKKLSCDDFLSRFHKFTVPDIIPHSSTDRIRLKVQGGTVDVRYEYE